MRWLARWLGLDGFAGEVGFSGELSMKVIRKRTTFRQRVQDFFRRTA